MARGCRLQVRSVVDDTQDSKDGPWPTSSPGSRWRAPTRSMPPWVLFNFPQAAKIIKNGFATPRAGSPTASGAVSTMTPPGN